MKNKSQTSYNPLIEWINEFFGIQNDVSSTIIITLTVFILGQFATYLFKIFNKKKDYRDLRFTVKIVLQRIIKNLKNKEESIREFYNTLSPEYTGIVSLNTNSIDYIDSYFDLNSSQVILAFRTKFQYNLNSKFKNEAFYTIRPILKNLEQLNERLSKNADVLETRFAEYHKSYNSSLMEYRNNLERLKSDLKDVDNSNIDKAKLIEIDKIHYAWQQLDLGEKERVRYLVTYENIVKPLLKIDRSNQNLQIFNFLDPYLLNCSHQFDQIQTLMAKYQEQYRWDYLSVRKSRRLLIRIIRILY